MKPYLSYFCNMNIEKEGFVVVGATKNGNEILNYFGVFLSQGKRLSLLHFLLVFFIASMV